MRFCFDTRTDSFRLLGGASEREREELDILDEDALPLESIEIRPSIGIKVLPGTCLNQASECRVTEAFRRVHPHFPEVEWED